VERDPVAAAQHRRCRYQRTNISVGAKVTVYGHRHMSKLEMKSEELTMGQRTYNLYAWHWGPTDGGQLAQQP
jgi:hypothetical protein